MSHPSVMPLGASTPSGDTVPFDPEKCLSAPPPWIGRAPTEEEFSAFIAQGRVSLDDLARAGITFEQGMGGASFRYNRRYLASLPYWVTQYAHEQRQLGAESVRMEIRNALGIQPPTPPPSSKS